MPITTQLVDESQAWSSGFRLVTRQARGRDSIDCWLALPDVPRLGARPLVAVHGIHRDAEGQARAFAARAAAEGRPVIAPLFDKARWPSYQRLVHRGRADLALLSLMETLRGEQIWTTRRFDLFGYSGGAQFGHRFAMFYPHLVGRLVLCSPGWWTFPDQAPFPYGLGVGDRPGGRWGTRLQATLPGFLRLQIAVAVGANDDVRDESTRSGADIDRQQGTDRKTRAIRWVNSMAAAARARSMTPRTTLAILPDCGHDFGECVERGRLAELVLPIEADAGSAGRRAQTAVDRSISGADCTVPANSTSIHPVEGAIR